MTTINGTLVIRPLTANLTRDTDFFTKMDPYVRITMGTETQKTTVAKKAGKNPSWKDEVTVRHTNQDIIKIEVWDKDKHTKDDLVGAGTISFSRIQGGGNKLNEWLQLSHKGKSAGKLLLDIQFYPDGKETEAKKEEKRPEQYQQYQVNGVGTAPVMTMVPNGFMMSPQPQPQQGYMTGMPMPMQYQPMYVPPQQQMFVQPMFAPQLQMTQQQVFEPGYQPRY